MEAAKDLLVRAAIIVRDQRGGILLQVKDTTRAWGLPDTELEPHRSVREAARYLTKLEYGVDFHMEDYLGTYCDRYTLRLDAHRQQPLLMIVVIGSLIHGSPESLETLGRRFFDPHDLPVVAERAHLDALTDYLAGRRGILR